MKNILYRYKVYIQLLDLFLYPKYKLLFFGAINSIFDICGLIIIIQIGLSLLNISNTNFLNNLDLEDNQLLIFIILIAFLRFTASSLFYKYYSLKNSKLLNEMNRNIILHFLSNPFKSNEIENSKFLRTVCVDINYVLPGLILPTINLSTEIFVLIATLITITIFLGLENFLYILFICLIFVIFIYFIKKLFNKSSQNKSTIEKQRVNLYNYIISNKIFLNSTNAIKKFFFHIDLKNEILFKINTRHDFQKNLYRPILEFSGVIFFIILTLFFNEKAIFCSILLVRLIPSLSKINIILLQSNFHFHSVNDFMTKYNSLDSLNLNQTNESVDKLFIENNQNLKFKFEVSKGYINTITGKSGSGKTTLLNEISGDKRTNFWNIKASIDLTHKDTNFYAIFYLQQKLENSDLSIRELIEIMQIDTEVFISNLKKFKVELNDVDLDRNLNHFSGGEIQRIYLSFIEFTNKQIIILDEPSNNLDEKSSLVFMNILEKIKKDYIILIVTHDNAIIDNSDFILNIDEFTSNENAK